MKTDITMKCPACGKFVAVEEAFYTREEPDRDLGKVLPCCDVVCADIYVERYFLAASDRRRSDKKGEAK